MDEAEGWVPGVVEVEVVEKRGAGEVALESVFSVDGLGGQEGEEGEGEHVSTSVVLCGSERGLVERLKECVAKVWMKLKMSPSVMWERARQR